MPTSAILIVLCSTVIHASWNLLVRSQRTTHTFLRATLITAAVGLGPALAAEFLGTPFPRVVWGYLALSGICQGCYYLGLSRGYQSGDFSVVYPVARVVPTILVALIDVAQGRALAPAGWLGIGMVSAGCLIVPLESVHSFKLSNYRNRALAWALLAALGTVGYTVVDHTAAGLISTGVWGAVRYEVFETAFSAAAYGMLLRGLRQTDRAGSGLAGWTVPAIVGAGIFAAYALVLWAYQLTPQASYVVALRQLSIVIGAAAGAFLFKEPAPALRIGAATLIVLGVACVALAG